MRESEVNPPTTLENWGIVGGSLSGNVYNHPNKKFFPGDFVVTSSITSADRESRTVTTKSDTVYLLGTVSEEYERLFPDSLNRLFTSHEKCRDEKGQG